MYKTKKYDQFEPQLKKHYNLSLFGHLKLFNTQQQKAKGKPVHQIYFHNIHHVLAHLKHFCFMLIKFIFYRFLKMYSVYHRFSSPCQLL